VFAADIGKEVSARWMDTGSTVLSSPAGLQGHYSGTKLPGCVSRLSNPFGNKEDHHISSPLAASPGRLVLPTVVPALIVPFGHSHGAIRALRAFRALTVHFEHSACTIHGTCTVQVRVGHLLYNSLVHLRVVLCAFREANLADMA